MKASNCHCRSLLDNSNFLSCLEDRLNVQDRHYQRKKTTVEKFIKKSGKIDHSVILNNVDIDYDTLMWILSDLRSEGRIK